MTAHPDPKHDDLADTPGAVPSGPPAGLGEPAPARRSLVRLVVSMLVALALGAAVSLIHLPYAIMSPGPAVDVLGEQRSGDGSTVARIRVAGAPTYPTAGRLDFTTVRVRGGPGYAVNVVDVLAAWLAADQDVYSVDELFPPQVTQEQVAQENRVEMTGSQQVAAAVALRAVGYDVPLVLRVTRLVDGAPATGQLQAGDVLVSIAGAPVANAEGLRAAIAAVRAGDAVEMVVRRGEAQVTVHPRTGTAPDGRTYVGIALAGDYRMPVAVTIDAGDVGGPSAGLMFALGIYDKLTDGALTGAASVAGTGTIDDGGAVGPIGGIAQKMAGARQAGASVFLAPAGSCPEVRGREPDGMTVVKVATFAEARAALEAVGRSQTGALARC